MQRVGKSQELREEVVHAVRSIVELSRARPRIFGVKVTGAHPRAGRQRAEQPDDAERFEAIGVGKRAPEIVRRKLAAAEAVRANRFGDATSLVVRKPVARKELRRMARRE